MERSLWIAKTGLDAQRTRMAIVAHNLANVNTTGFKRGRGVFADLIYQTIRQPGAQSTESSELPSGLMLGTGVRVVATEKLFQQGNIVQTENPLDLALQGRGFFQILQSDGSVAYTRDGQFQITSTGTLVTSNGLTVQPGLTIPPDTISLTIGSDGTVSALVAGNTTPTQIGQFQLADFINPVGLQPFGDNLFVETAASGAPQTGNPGAQGLATLIQGALESSNVNVVEELVNMIETQRAYEMNAKSIETTDEMLRYVSNNL